MKTENIIINFDLSKGEFYNTILDSNGRLVLAKSQDGNFVKSGYWISEILSLKNATNLYRIFLQTNDSSNVGISIEYRQSSQESWTPTNENYEFLEELQEDTVQIKVILTRKAEFDVNEEESVRFTADEQLELVTTTTKEQQDNFVINNQRLSYSPSNIEEKSGATQLFTINKSLFEFIHTTQFLAPFGDKKLQAGSWYTEGVFKPITNLEEELEVDNGSIESIIYDLLDDKNSVPVQQKRTWLKWTVKGKTILMPTQPIATNVSPKKLHEQNLVKGDTIIKIGGHNFRVRLLKGLRDNSVPEFLDTHYSEWNRLILPAVNSEKWVFPNNVENNLDIWLNKEITQQVKQITEPILTQEIVVGSQNREYYVVRNHENHPESVTTFAKDTVQIIPGLGTVAIAGETISWYPVLEYIEPNRYILFRKNGEFGFYQNSKFEPLGKEIPNFQDVKEFCVNDLEQLQEKITQTKKHMNAIESSEERDYYITTIDLNEMNNLIKIEVETNE